MHALGIPSTRAVAVVGADEPVFRESVETAAVVTRMSPSFVRFGHFEHFYHAGRHEELRVLADYVIDRFYPALRREPQPHAALLREVVERTARLIAAWQSVGFCHGVMNTDNMSILGLTIDYGPFGFLDGFDAHHVCNHSDSEGRYSYANQPAIGEWNCYCLGQALVPLLGSVDETRDALAVYRPVFAAELERRLLDKLGLTQAREGDAGCRDLFVDRAAFDAWAADYRARPRSRSRPRAVPTSKRGWRGPVRRTARPAQAFLTFSSIRKTKRGDPLNMRLSDFGRQRRSRVLRRLRARSAMWGSKEGSKALNCNRFHTMT